MDNDKETKNWHFIIKAAALRNGTSLEEQQLTKDFVPVIVDKCINFVYAHGNLLLLLFFFVIYVCQDIFIL